MAARATSPAATAPARSTTPAGDKITLPLNEILSRLPEDLAALVLKRAQGTFSLSTSVAVEQLRTGAVRVPFAQLRQASPPGTFANDASHDDSLIDLPLGLILAAIGPAGLARRSNQKQTNVPDEVIGVFGAKDRKLTISGAPGSAPAAAPSASHPAPSAPVAPPPSAPPPVAPTSAPIPTPIPTKPVTPVAAPPVAHKPTTFITQSPTAPNIAVSSPLPFATSKPSSPLPFASTRPSPPPPAAAPAASGETVVVTVETVSVAWPEAIRQEIQQFNLGSAAISIPVSRLELGMKSGRIVFTWAELCGWLSEPPPASANGPSEVELPLQVLAPLFLAKHRAATPRKIVTVAEDVPNLFAGVVQPAAAPLPEPTPAPVPEPAPAEVEAAAPAPVVAPVVPEESAIPLPEGDMTLQEVVQWMMSLPGVAGVVLASTEGLLVAGQLPPPLESETMAAFLPQILMRINVCTEEVRLGKLRSVKILVGETPCAMFKAGALCLAVLGQPGKTLPEAALERMAGELAQQNQ